MPIEGAARARAVAVVARGGPVVEIADGRVEEVEDRARVADIVERKVRVAAEAHAEHALLERLMDGEARADVVLPELALLRAQPVRAPLSCPQLSLRC